MQFSSLFINRPVLGTVLNILIVLFGIIGVTFLGVRDYPAVDPPVITVSTSYTGANQDVIETQITEPLEESINGIGGIRTLTSSSAEGRSSISVEFNLGTDLEGAANDVRDRVSRAMRNLPKDADPPIISKQDANATPIINIALKSEKRSPLELTDYAINVFKERLQTIPEVSEVTIWGEKRYAMRIWLDPNKMAASNISPQDILTALNRENVELPSGRIEGAATELTIRTMSGLHTEEDFKNLIIKETSGGVTRLSDVASAEFGAENERLILKRDGIPMIAVSLIPQPGANHIAIADEFYKRYKILQSELPPDIKSEMGFDFTTTIRKSITEVIETIAIAFFLVMLVIFVFFRTWRATLIPMLAIPISLIGAFFIMYLCNFSINILTLLAIVLATGLVVDDAIVVLENIYTKIESGLSPVDAGHKGASEIFFAIIATTLSLVAVLMPVVFLQGITGRLFREFGVVVAGSVLLSAFVSLSLTPMLCTKLLRQHAPHGTSFYSRTEPFFERMITWYRTTLTSFMKKRWLAFPALALSLGLFSLFLVLPDELAPLEDRSRLMLASTLPEGTSYEYSLDYMDNLYDRLIATVPEKSSVMTLVPFRSGGSSVNSGMLRVFLVDPEKRTRSQQEIADQLTREVRQYTGGRTSVQQEPTIGDRRSGLPVQFVIQAPTLEKLKEKLPVFLQEASANPLFSIVDVNMKFNKPELKLDINREKARDLGVSALDVAQTLQLSLGGTRYGYFIRNGKQYQIIGQYARNDRGKPADLLSSYVKNKEGNLVQLDNIVSLTETSSPPQLFRFNRFVSATVSAGLTPGQTIGEGNKEMKKLGKKLLDDSFSTDFAGQSRDFAESASNIYFAFGLALVLVFLVLAAQFESFRSPLIVMLTVPFAISGAFLALWYFNQTMNIFSKIGIIMLIGLVTKNGILIVEFANQRRRAGMPLMEAIIDGAASRFRPILMTTLTVVLGSLPIALAIGAGAKSRVSMGIVIIGGLLFSLVLSLFVVPAVYSYISSKERLKG